MVALNNLIFVATMSLKTEVFNIRTSQEFKKTALAVFKHQFEHNRTYRSFCDLLYIHPSDVHSVEQIPFLPIQFFKTHTILSKAEESQVIFSSSGTTGSVTSKHHVADLAIYKKSFRKGFDNFYGNIEEYTVLALLPSYLEREGSSLIYMVEDLIKRSKKPNSGFYLNNLEELCTVLTKLDALGEKVLLIGVSFALLDLLEKHSFKLKNTIIMETQ